MPSPPKPSHWEKLIASTQMQYNFGKLITFSDLLSHIGITKGEQEYAYPIAQLSAPIKSSGGMSLIKNTIRGYEWSYDQDKVKDYVAPSNLQLGEYLSEHLPKREAIVTYSNAPIIINTVESLFNCGIKVDSVMVEEESFKYPLCWTPKSKHPKQLATLRISQEKAAAQMLYNIVEMKHTGMLLDCIAGGGKTFMLFATLRRLFDSGYISKLPLVPFPVVWVTKASVVKQTKRVGEKDFGFAIGEVGGIEIINYEQFRAKYGKMWIKKTIKIENGEEVVHWVWQPFMTPHIFIIDESHSLKNTNTTMSKQFQALNDFVPPMKSWPTPIQIHSSATPYMRVCDAKCLAVSTRIPFYGRPLSNVSWNDFAHEVAEPAAPDDYVEAAVERLTKKLEPFIVHVTGLRSQFKTFNKCKLIDFSSKKERDYYHSAWKRFQADRLRLNQNTQEGRMMILARFTKFRMAAELCRAWIIAKICHRDIMEGYQPIVAGCFKQYIGKVVYHLVYDFGIPRSQISIIWGGGAQAARKNKNLKALESGDIDSLAATMRSMGISEEIIRDTLKIQDGTEREAMDQFNKQVEDKLLRLGAQSPDERDDEIEKFQSGKAKVCLFTFKAGGVGLSLHHCDDFVSASEKVLRKESGYAVEEDIPMFVARTNIKPRRTYLTPTFSAVELVQGLGRGHRLTSLSHTDQTLLYYKGTIEVEVAATTNQKLKCLRHATKQNDTWVGIIQDAVSINDTYATPEGLEEEIIELEGIDSITTNEEDEEDE